MHYNGQRLYELARKGIFPEDIPTRNVRIDSLTVLEFDGHCAKLDISCSKGTYIRSIVRDIGEQLGTGAVMTGLLRTQSGLFRVENAVLLDDLHSKEDVQKIFTDPFEVLPYKRYSLKESELAGFMNGVAIQNISEYSDGEIVLVEYKGKLAGVCRKNLSKLTVAKVFPLEELKK